MKKELRFEWDEKKDKKCRKKHGIPFEIAKNVFYDPMSIEGYDLGHSLIEERWNIIGLVGQTVLRVTYTKKNGIFRIISARKAEDEEEEEYFYGYDKNKY